MNFYDEQYIEDIRQALPIIFTRETACKLLGVSSHPKRSPILMHQERDQRENSI